MNEFVVELSPYDSKRMRALNVYFFEDISKIPGRDFVSVSPSDAIKIKRKLAGNILLISREDSARKDNELASVTIENFSTQQADSFESLKHKYVIEMSTRISFAIANLSALEIYEYFMSLMGLAENGFIITDRNREDKYIEIINTGREDLISLLETYLDNRDVIETTYSQYKRFRDARNSISRSSSIEEINEILKGLTGVNLQEQVKVE